MGRTSRQTKHCQNICQQRQQVRQVSPLITERPGNPLPKVHKTLTVVNAVMEGTGFQAQKRTILRYGMRCSSKATFFREQKPVLDNLKEFVTDQMEGFANNIQPGAHISTDTT